MLFTKKNGWIGVDIGTSTVKVVQLVRRNDRRPRAQSAYPNALMNGLSVHSTGAKRDSNRRQRPAARV